MSTDDFEARLRARLTDLAEHEDDWADPLPEARRQGSAPDPDDAGDVRVLTPPRRRRWVTNLAVAAVALAIVAGGGLGIHALVRGSSSGSASSGSAAGAGVSVPGDPSGLPSLAPGGASSAVGATADPGGDDGSGCAAATSTGPLAAIATIRPLGIVGPSTTSGTPVAVPYQLTFGQAAGTAQVRPARVVQVVNGQVCAPGGVSAGVVEAVPVAPGAGTSGSATFAAADASGAPLAAGGYQVAIVIPYTVDGSGPSQLVSTPITVTVS